MLVIARLPFFSLFGLLETPQKSKNKHTDTQTGTVASPLVEALVGTNPPKFVPSHL